VRAGEPGSPSSLTQKNVFCPLLSRQHRPTANHGASTLASSDHSRGQEFRDLQLGKSSGNRSDRRPPKRRYWHDRGQNRIATTVLNPACSAHNHYRGFAL